MKRFTNINANDILDTLTMIHDENLDVRTVTMGINLLDCADPDPKVACEKLYEKIVRHAEDLVPVCERISMEYGIPIVNKRVAVTPIALLLGCAPQADPVAYAKALDRAADTVGINFIGGYSALVHKGFAAGDVRLIRSIPQALSETGKVCSSVNIGTTKSGINMDAVAMMGTLFWIRRGAPPTATASARPSWWCSATRRRITRSWRARFMVWVSRTWSSTSAYPAPARCEARC